MSGWTLIEMLVVVAVLTVLATLGAPALGTLQARLAVHTGLQDTLGFLNASRSEALVHNRIEICSEYGCDAFPWSQTLVARAENGTVTNTLELPEGVHVTWRGFRGTSLLFHERGRLKFQNGHLLICHQRGTVEGRKVILNWVGRARWERVRPEDCRDS